MSIVSKWATRKSSSLDKKRFGMSTLWGQGGAKQENLMKKENLKVIPFFICTLLFQTEEQKVFRGKDSSWTEQADKIRIIERKAR